MQNEYKIGQLPALPPAIPIEQVTEKRKSNRSFALQLFLCVLCATTAIAVITLSAVQKIKEIKSIGVLNYAKEELLCLGKDGSSTLGDKISYTAFGSFSLSEVFAKTSDTSLKLPRVYYVPKEQIANQVFTEKEEEENSILNLYSADLSSVPKDAYPIIPSNLCAKDATDIKNETSFSIDKNAVARDASLLEPAMISGEPLVLIVHTHGTESFSEERVAYYNEEINYPRNTDVSKNVVAVGKVIADALNRAGIPTLHCETMHDKESYINAYTRSAESIKYYLEKYPSIQYVFDIHRDSLIRSDMTKIKPISLYGGAPCAQIMMIVGTNDKGANLYDWAGNLVLAEAIQQKLFKDANEVARQIILRGATYNQQYAKHGILVEIGACGNTLSEAKNAASAFADALIKTIKGT